MFKRFYSSYRVLKILGTIVAVLVLLWGLYTLLFAIQKTRYVTPLEENPRLESETVSAGFLNFSGIISGNVMSNCYSVSYKKYPSWSMSLSGAEPDWDWGYNVSITVDIPLVGRPVYQVQVSERSEEESDPFLNRQESLGVYFYIDTNGNYQGGAEDDKLARYYYQETQERILALLDGMKDLYGERYF